MSRVSIGNFILDINKGVLYSQGEPVCLEPKTLKVLLVLLEQPGEVVSHDELFEKAWPNVIVDLNSLQRCIGQLRKAFKDDRQNQLVIATFSKRGYALVAPVESSSFLESFLGRLSRQVAQKASMLKWGVAGFLMVALASAVTYGYLIRNNQATLAFPTLTPLTVTDETEFYSVFSPDGRYVAFARQTEGPYNHLLVKDLETSDEFRITEKAGILNEPAWSPDGKSLAFVSVQCQDANCLVPKRRCMGIDIVDVSFPAPIPSESYSAIPCQPQEIITPQWLATSKLAYIEASEHSAKVIELDLATGEKSQILEDEGFRPYFLSYSGKFDQLAIATRKLDDSPDPVSELLLWSKSYGISKKLELARAETAFWRPIWDERSGGFLMARGNSIYYLDLEGNISPISFPSSENIFLPQVHPDNEGIAMTIGEYDYDIGELVWEDRDANDIEPLYRTTKREEYGQYHPWGESIAFYSNRTGISQIWFAGQGELSQVSSFERDQRPDSLKWSPDGSMLATGHLGQIHLFSMSETDFQATRYSGEFSEVTVLQWIDDDRLLIMTSDGTDRQLVSFNINSENFTTLLEGGAGWAQMSDSGEIYVQLLDDKGFRKIYRFTEYGLFNLPHLENLNTLPGFVLKEQTLYIADISRQLVSYSLGADRIDQILDLGESRMRAISDVDPDLNRVLINNRPWMRSELVYWHN